MVVLVLLRWLDGRARPGFWSTDSMAELILAALRRRRLGWAADELVWLTRFLVAHCAELGRTVSITAHIVADGLDRCPAAAAQIGDDARRLADFLVADQRNPSPTSGYTDLSSLIARFSAWAGQDKGGTIPEHLLGDDDSFGARARAALLAVVDEAAAAQALELCAASGNAPRPSTRWRREVAQRAAARADVVDAARILASTVIGQPEPVPDEYGWAYTWISEGSEILIGALWIARDELAGDDAVSLLRDIGAYCAQSARTPGLGVRSQRITNAVIAALFDGAAGGGTRPLPVAEAAAALLAVRHKAASRALSIAVDKAIAGIATHHQIEPATLAESAVPSYGLDDHGRLERPVGAYTAVVEVAAGRVGVEVTLEWRNSAGRVLSGVPAAVRKAFPEIVADLQRLVRDLRRSYPAQRDRIDQLMASRRSWPVADWRRNYLDHPLIGVLARSLIWTVADPVTPTAQQLSGVPVRVAGEWRLVDAAGSPHPIPVDAEVGLWHPLGRPVEQVMAWRRAVTDREVHQPFKQAFREIYLLTPAEAQTDTYSNRFAAHILRYRQMAALMRARDWRPPQLGGWDHEDADAIRSYYDLRCVFHVESVDDARDEPESAELCSSDHVRFETTDDAGEWHRMRLVDVDPLVFSESMRDVDLFVGVTSIATDPAWTTDGRRAHQDYWSRTSFGAAQRERRLPSRSSAAAAAPDSVGRRHPDRGPLPARSGSAANVQDPPRVGEHPDGTRRQLPLHRAHVSGPAKQHLSAIRR